MSQAEPPFSVRLGRLVEARDCDGMAIELGYEPAERVIAKLLENGREWTAEIFGRVVAPGFSLCDADTVKDILQKEGLQPSTTARTSHVMPAVDLDEVCATISGQHYLVRPAVTVCATYSPNAAAATGHLPVYSKIWFRFIPLSRGKAVEEQSASDVYRSIQAVSDRLFDSAYLTYGEIMSSVCGPDTTIHKVGEIEIYSDTIDKPQFQDLLDAISCASKAQGTREAVSVSDRNFSRISEAFLRVDSRELATEATGQSPALFLEALRKVDPASVYKLVSVNGHEGYEGVYLAKIFESGAKFVGLASGALRSPTDNGQFRPTKSAANVVSAIIANDLVVGL